MDVLFERADDEQYYVNKETALLTLANKALQFASASGEPKDVAYVYMRMADVHWMKGRRDDESLKTATQYLVTADKYYSEELLDNELSATIAELHRRKGLIYAELYQNDNNPIHVSNAASSFDKAILYANATGDYFILYDMYSTLSEVYFRINDRVNATDSICRAARLGSRIQRDPQAIISDYLRMTRQDLSQSDFNSLCAS